MKLPIEEVFLSDTSKSYQYHVWQKESKIRKIYSKLFTQNMTDDINQIVRRNLWDIVKLLYPSAIIADRTALELKPAEDGSIFVISDKKRPASIGNITIKPRKGTAPLDNDKLFMGNLYLPSTERALLENLKGYRSGSNEISRCLKDAEIEEYLDKTLSRYGEDALNNLRDNARKISAKLELSEEFNKLNKMISALLQTRQVPLKSNMNAYQIAIQIAKEENKWEPHPSRENQKIAFVPSLKNYWWSDRTQSRKKYYDNDDVEINACVVWDEESDNYFVFATTDTSVTAKQIILTYELRPEIEED